MRPIRIKFTDETLEWLRANAKLRGRTLRGFIREVVDEWRAAPSVYSLTSDLAGSQKGRRSSAIGRKFRPP